MQASIWTAAPVPGVQAAWIQSRRWDVGWLIGSALVVPLVLLLVWSGVSSLGLTLGITALVGGPHLFSTYVATFLDPRFRRSHRLGLIGISICIPALVIYGTLANFQVLLSAFIFLASLHVVQQNLFLTDVYRKRAAATSKRREPWSARAIDYAVLMLSLHPIASYKLVHGEFALGPTQVLLPAFLRTPITYWTIWVLFGAALTLWITKTLHEWRSATLNGPKSLLIGETTVIAFFVPMAASGARLELAFQSVNAWHSIQYLGIVWFVLKTRKQDRRLSGIVARIAGSDRRATLLFYATCFAMTFSLLGLWSGLVAWNPLSIGTEQYYYMCVLSFLLIHYALDGYLFAVSTGQTVSVDDVPFASASTIAA